MYSHARWQHRGLAHQQPLANDPYDQHSRCCSCARVNHDQLPRAQIHNRRRPRRAAPLGAMVCDRRRDVRGLPRRHVFCCSLAYRRLGQPPPAYLERSRFRCWYYRAQFQPAVDRNRPGFVHSLADRDRKCAAHLGVAYAVLSAITALYYLATIEIAQYLGRNRRDLLLMTRSKAELAQSLDTALANMSHGLCMFDRHLRLLVWNTRFCEIYGIEPEALSAGLPLSQVIELSASRSNQPNRTAAEMTAEFEARMARGVLSHWKRELPGGRIIALSHQPMAEGGAVVIFEDVTERDQAEARARFFATHDGLTGLPNRLTFGQAVSDAVKVGRRNGQEFAVMFIDLDRFKCINDTLGHAAGDTLLTEIANRLKHCLEGNDVVARDRYSVA
jgi:PAS domain-containing protein